MGWWAGRCRRRAPCVIPILAIPSPAWAGVCDKVRPFWDPASGPASALTEALHLAASLPSIVLIIATALALRFRNAWSGLAVVCGWSLWVGFLVFGHQGDPTSVQQLAVKEGCIGSPSLFIAVIAAICVAIILQTAPNKAPPRNQE